MLTQAGKAVEIALAELGELVECEGAIGVDVFRSGRDVYIDGFARGWGGGVDEESTEDADEHEVEVVAGVDCVRFGGEDNVEICVFLCGCETSDELVVEMRQRGHGGS